MKISNKSTFQPDGRNMGGRTQVINQHFNHRESLQNIKPILNIQQILDSPQITKKSNLSQPLYKKINEFHEIYETFRRVACVKQGLTDSLTPPETFCLIRSHKKPFQKDFKWKNIFYDVPINQELNEETLAETKAQLVDVLIKYRLYKQEEFQNIQEIFTFKNPHIDKEIIQSVFKEIIEAFNE
ncbi:hypothetical protein PPERSA_12671 [Pseudocohnilembus persalinus]|uniref:Uncharacterized protein n=1 Tax=Pseudocohnilembus persalinus TaxID=266149 RepID=A0A0V0QN47_PSEPJ|nr:hypothetical protein PPERSA_12671 [Pseudocohnilembus persalinus]|eukprot:KRX03392.1 hypothetical protein PPERSA_12671 [Pseudocohnilembus persalinus]